MLRLLPLPTPPRSVPVRLRVGATAIAATALLLGACGDGEDRPGQVTSESGGSGSGSGSASGSSSGAGGETAASSGDDGFKPVSGVDPHAAIGDDIAAIKKLLGAAKGGGGKVDWAAVEAVWANGGASKKGDGSNRTLKTLVKDPVVGFVDAAIAGTGTAAKTDPLRAQQVDKGISVLLARKVVEELAAAKEKIAAGKTAPADGAPHNVDEAWAFFTAKGNGLAGTADKRAADFKRAGRVREPIIEALTRAQKAADAGDAAAFDAGAADVAEGLDYIFYLATFKYLGSSDEVGRAEGATFFLGIEPKVEKADPTAAPAIEKAFAEGNAAAGREALHRPAVLTALGIEPSEQVEA